MQNLLPLIALVPFIVSFPVSANYALPYAVLVALISVVFPRATSDKLRFPLTMFWVSGVPLVWAMSEQREGRDFWVYSIPVSLGICALGTMWTLRVQPQKAHIPWIVAALLTWCVCYFGGSTGSADGMREITGAWGLSPAAVKFLIVTFRKTVHVVFYATLATCLFLAWERQWKWAIFGAAIIAGCDEWRQSLMPNRAGSFWDVLIDLGGASVWLWWKYFKGRSATSSARSQNAPE